MATITISDIPRSPMARVVVMLNGNEGVAYEIPKQIADLITVANSLNIVNRANLDRVIAGA